MKRKRKPDGANVADLDRSGSMGATLKINGILLQTFVLGALAWLLWPSSLQWWGFGFISVILGAASLGKLTQALRAMIKIHAREKELSRLAAMARAPVQSDLANDSAMENAGMFDD